MDAFNLKTASTYINNLLLARGLLRDGKPIEFAHPSRGEGGKEVTMAQIINLVHDLILKRDRDQEHRESLAGTLRTLRTEATRQTLALEKLQTRNDDLSRQIHLSQSQERSARTALRTAESSARSLREEMLRLKTTVQQVRTSCANDIRKRDVQIQRLKSHLTAQQRGNKTGLVGASITITPGATGMNGVGYGAREDDVPAVDDPEYSLKQETTEFLTQLSQSLSDENDNLIGLVRSTLSTLKELQGIPEGLRSGDENRLSVVQEEDGESMLHALPTSYEALATDMDVVLENLKTLLTNPNFVPIDEVELREEEIVRLRAGWEKMEVRWREAVTLMQGWRKRMASGGDTINLEELSMGLGLGVGLETINKEDASTITVEEEEVGSEGLEDVAEEEELEEPPSPEPDDIPEKTTNSDMFKLKLHPDPSALREVNGNGTIKSPRRVAFAPSSDNTPSKDVDENASEMDLVGDGAKASSPTKSDAPRSRPKTQESRIPRQTQKRLSSPRPHPEERSTKLSVHDKLKVAQAEAEAAAVAEGLETVPSSADRRVSNGEGHGQHEHNRRRSSPRKTRIGGRPKRRKSTLTPEELDNLLGV